LYRLELNCIINNWSIFSGSSKALYWTYA